MMGWLKRALGVRPSAEPVEQVCADPPPMPSLRQPAPTDISGLLADALERLKRGDDAAAANRFREVVSIDPRNATAHNHLAVALGKMGRFQEAERHLRLAVGIEEAYPDAHFNLGLLLQLLGQFRDAERPLRRALQLQPTSARFQSILGINLLTTGCLREARGLLEKVLQVEPANAHALLAMGQLAVREGRFGEAETMFRRTLEVNVGVHGAWVGLAGVRKMTTADSAWLTGAEGCANSGLGPLSQAEIRYAIGKYHDDLENFDQAFRSYQRANELLRTVASPYDRAGRSALIDDLIRVYTRATLSRARPGASDSPLPVLVTGMPRSGTSLVEQIIASHPAAKGAGELSFWGRSFHEAQGVLRQSPPDEALTKMMAHGYLRDLGEHGTNAQRVVDKQPFNADLLGIVHCVFPHARVIYVRRDPIDTCLSCFFQPFPATLNFTQDLSDLAHFYREHLRLIEHWRSALPPSTLLDVPYEALVADQEGWTRKILEFLGLPWDDHCLDFHSNERSVLTASSWQVRQKLYKSSVGRWRHYEKFIGPLLALKDLT
jgi:Flp pilus assembly protein TadD